MNRELNILSSVWGDRAARLHSADVAREKGFTLARAVHPRATIADGVEIGDGTVVVAGAVINPGCSIVVTT